MISIKRILCPVDLSDCSGLALGHAAALASWYDSRLTVLHVYSDVPVFDIAPALRPTGMPPLTIREIDREEMLQALHRFADPRCAHVDVDVQLREAPDARRVIIHQATELEADLLVMGTHGRSGFDHFLLGSVTEKVIRRSPCPVMIVPRHSAPAAPPSSAPFKCIVCALDFSGR